VGAPVFSSVADMFAAVFDVRRVLLWEDDVVWFAKARVGLDIVDCVYFSVRSRRSDSSRGSG